MAEHIVSGAAATPLHRGPWSTEPDGSLPSGKQIADRYGRHERWGRLT